MKQLLICLLTAGLFAGCNQDRSGSEAGLVSNGGFEMAANGFASGWKPIISGSTDTDCVRVTRKEIHSGRRAMEIGRVWAESWEMNGIQTENAIEVDPEEKYMLSFWYRTSGIAEYPIPLVTGFRVNRETETPLRYNKFLSTQEEWTRVSWLLDTLPPDATSTDIVFYVWIRTEGSVYIDDISIKIASSSEIAQYEDWRRIDPPLPLGNAQETAFRGNGFFRVENDSTRWWLVDPAGRANWAIATMGEIPGKQGNGNVELAERFESEYQGDRMKYAEMNYGLLQSWGFNSLAGWTAGEYAEISERKYSRGEEYLPMFRVLNFSIMGADKDYYAKDNSGASKSVNDHSFPDPFNPTWRSDARKKAEAIIEEFNGDPWFVGWFMDNEIDYSSLFRYVWGDYSAREFISYLESKYGAIDLLNETWTSSFGDYRYTSFQDILADKPEPMEWEDPLFEDFVSFERIMMEEYINYTYEMVRELDPDHLIISNRLNLGPMSCLYRTIDLWSRYDVICVNMYPENLFIGFDKGELEILDRIHKQTGKPIIIGEWSVPAMDSKLYEFGEDPYLRPLDWSWPQVLRNQAERGEVYRTCMMQLASKPYIIGAAWFKVLDVDSPSRRANRGLITSGNRPYHQMTDSVSKTNHEIRENMNLPW